MTSPLEQIPSKVRLIAYWVGYVTGVIGQSITIIWGAVAAASPDVSMPLALVVTSAVLGLLQTQLNLLAGSNVGASGLSEEQLQEYASRERAIDSAIAGARPFWQKPE